MVADLTGLELANASLLDEATAAAEAMAMAKRVGKSGADAFFVDADCHPQTLAVLRTRAARLRLRDRGRRSAARPRAASEVFGALLHYPGSSGAVRDFRAGDRAAARRSAALAIMATDLLSLVAADAARRARRRRRDRQRPALRRADGLRRPARGVLRHRATPYKRAMPGRLIGVSVDRHGRPALRMALQTREQHIRREKATSNICTAQVLLAVMAAMYAVYHGPDGLTADRARGCTA